MKLILARRFQRVTLLIVNNPSSTHSTSQLQWWMPLSLRFQSDKIKTHIKLLEDKLLRKITALKLYLLNDILGLGNYITLLKENNEKGKPADSNNEREEVLLIKEKIKVLESENSFLKSDITIKQKATDSILGNKSDLLNHQCCCKILTMKSIKKVVKIKKWKKISWQKQK